VTILPASADEKPAAPGQSLTPPGKKRLLSIVLPQTVKVEAKDNHLPPIEVDPPPREP
jgi:hypothetical protein